MRMKVEVKNRKEIHQKSHHVNDLEVRQKIIKISLPHQAKMINVIIQNVNQIQMIPI
jgi:hypothetical protein